jgi:hypothetical protein
MRRRALYKRHVERFLSLQPGAHRPCGRKSGSPSCGGQAAFGMTGGGFTYPGLGSAKGAEPSWAKFFAVPFGTQCRSEVAATLYEKRLRRSLRGGRKRKCRGVIGFGGRRGRRKWGGSGKLFEGGRGRRREIPLSANPSRLRVNRRTQNVRKKKPGRCVRNDRGLFSVPRIGFGKRRRTILRRCARRG